MNSEMIFYAGLGVMILTTLLGRTVKERGMKTLSHEQLGFVMASFSKMRMVGMYILFSIVGLYLVLGYLKWLEYLTEMGINPTVVYFVLIMLYIITSQGLSIAKLRKMDLPTEYLRSVYVGAGLQLLGICALLIGIINYMGQ
ncbi:hypothetical protein LBMAG26_14180 [Bacteroidota bacterium]|nr:hypothetical protein LBMAG26_14180 [Bacteroidota bacterium]